MAIVIKGIRGKAIVNLIYEVYLVKFDEFVF